MRDTDKLEVCPGVVYHPKTEELFIDIEQFIGTDVDEEGSKKILRGILGIVETFRKHFPHRKLRSYNIRGFVR